MNQYSFTCAEQQEPGLPEFFPKAKTTNVTLQFEDGVVWTVVVDQFLSFLSSVYGYDLSEQVEYLSFEEKKQMLRDKYDLEDL
jgi:hypothetical protein